mmetsp:Transcript_153843/g.493373  ORF Transcript_153843/g.493373 Transcript_153843/m.493373 type:complete len:210 (+) Transcript_153843:1248-1877(+)
MYALRNTSRSKSTAPSDTPVKPWRRNSTRSASRPREARRALCPVSSLAVSRRRPQIAHMLRAFVTPRTKPLAEDRSCEHNVTRHARPDEPGDPHQAPAGCCGPPSEPPGACSTAEARLCRACRALPTAGTLSPGRSRQRGRGRNQGLGCSNSGWRHLDPSATPGTGPGAQSGATMSATCLRQRSDSRLLPQDLRTDAAPRATTCTDPIL